MSKRDFRACPIHKASSVLAIDPNKKPDYYVSLQYDQIKNIYKSTVIVGVIDSGTELNHKYWDKPINKRIDFTGEGVAPGTHGCHVAGIVSSFYGISNDIPVISYKALTRGGSGSGSWIAKAIRRAEKDGVQVLNLSLGSNYSDRRIRAAIKDFVRDPKRFIICASGNDGWDGNDSTDYPAKLAKTMRGVISVGAGNYNNGDPKLARFSSKGVVTVTAQGVDVLSTITDNNIDIYSGTSMAAPQVAALISYAKSIYPDFQHFDLDYLLPRACCDMRIKGKDIETGYGFLLPLTFLNEVASMNPIFEPPPKLSHKESWLSSLNLVKYYEGIKKLLT